MKWNVLFLVIFGLIVYCKSNKPLSDQKSDIQEDWKLAFQDDCSKDWRKQWTLDGLVATVEHSEEGMHFRAGSEYKNDAHHAVLWTKASFSGDVKIEFDYTRTDEANQFVNILYIQATGDEEGIYEKDISKWKNLREVPKMKLYFENMNAFHISYAAFGNKGDGLHYVRARRYPKPDDKPFETTKIEPSYDMHGLFETGKTYHITAIKTAEKLSFEMAHGDKKQYFEWDVSKVIPITEGRIGIRHMFTRSAIYKNFKVYTN